MNSARPGTVLCRFTTTLVALSLIVGCSAVLPGSPVIPETADEPVSLGVPVEYFTLDNGLKAVISEDHSVPTVTIAVYYNIGFRIEPKGRTGFAHLFEHLMFQGSENLGKMAFTHLVQGNGGVVNGSTRFDYTNYFEVVPAHKLETILWAEADRMRTLDISDENLRNQQEVVKNEVRVNVLNRPYGGFPWLYLPQYAFSNWYNAHNFYGDMEDLDAATLEDARAFFNTYYAPNNAVLVVIGDLEADVARAMIEQHFGDIPRGPTLPAVDISEPPPVREIRAIRSDPLAPRPAVAIGYRMPPRGTARYYAMGILDQLLVQGEDSLLHQKLVKEHGVANGVSGGINALGNMYNYNGPVLWSMSLVHAPRFAAEDIVALTDEVLEQLAAAPVSDADLRRARTKMRSAFYDLLSGSTRFGLADLLAVFALFDDDPGRINRLEQEFADVTPELLMNTVRDVFRPQNRTVLAIEPGMSPAGTAP